MNFLKLFLISLVLILSACSTIPSSPEKIDIGEIEFTPLRPHQWQLENGLKVIYLQDNELPLISGKIFYPGGSLFVDKAKTGLSSLTGGQMREGSIPGFSPEEFDSALNSIGASIETSFGEEFGSSSFFCLSEDVDRVFSWFSSVLRKPSFDQSRLALAKHLATQGIKRRRDRPGTIAGMTFTRAFYGWDSPYARYTSEATLKNIKRSDLKKFHQRFVQPNAALLAMTGSLSLEEAKALVKKHLGSWKKSKVWEKPVNPELPDALKPGVYVVERDFEQAKILIGHAGPKRFSQDDFERIVYNRVFGHGGFSSILFSEIRSKLGLAYSVYGGFYPGTDDGMLQIAAGTRSEQAIKTAKEVIKLLEKSRVETFPLDKINNAKTSTKRSFVFRFESKSDVVFRQARQELLDYPEYYDQTYLDNVSSVKPEKVREFASNWVRPENLVIVVVGNVTAKSLKEAFPDRKVRELTFDTEPRLK